MTIAKWFALSGLYYTCLAFNLARAAEPRKDFSALKTTEIESLRTGVGKMMALDAGKPDLCPADKPNDCISPLGWRYQAFIHGKATGDRTAWDTCQHSSWFFLSWHRMELYFFERILRAMAGDPKLMLPYWNFSVPPVGMDPKTTGARLPAAFRVRPTATKANPLFWPARNAAVNKAPGPGVDDDTATPLRYDDVTTSAAFSAAAFFSNVEAMGGMTFGGGARQTERHFGGPGKGRIERTPHDRVHGAVGDGTPTSMTNAYGAGLDPIFWPVHANVDRAWACWQEKHPGTEPKSDAWLKNTVFTFFDVEMKSGQPSPVARRMTGQEIIDTAKQLSYTYDDNCRGFEVGGAAAVPKSLEPITNRLRRFENAGAGGNPIEFRSAVMSPVLGAEPVTLSIPIPGELQERIQSLVREGNPSGYIMLTIHDLAVDQLTAAAYGIYLNVPEGTTPLRHSEHYVDELTFFGMGHHANRHDHDTEHAVMPSQENSMTFDVTDVIRELMAKGKWRADEVSVTLANDAFATPDRASPPPAPAEARARFGYVSLTVN